MFKAEIIADSIAPYGSRIISYIITFPRFILAELNTHRMLSKNSASSRAIPFKKMLRAVWNNPFIPLQWMKDHSGMQGNHYFEGAFKKWLLRNLWLTARTMAIVVAWLLNKAGLTKQICNRILEPFMWHTVLITGTEWENFFALRAHEAAEIHMQKLAYLMLDAANNSKPKLLKPGEWHIPFGDKIDTAENAEAIAALMLPEAKAGKVNFDDILSRTILKIATARCAQTSYTLVGEEGKPMDFKKLVSLHDRLSKSGHWSPFEHCAKAFTKEEYYRNSRTWCVTTTDGAQRSGVSYGWSGNFCGWLQYRKMFPNEVQYDKRLLKTA